MEQTDFQNQDSQRNDSPHIGKAIRWFRILATRRNLTWRILNHLGILLVVVLGSVLGRYGVDAFSAERVNLADRLIQVSQVEPETGGQGLVDLTLVQYSNEVSSAGGIVRSIDLHTVRPDRPRVEVVHYVVESGDTLFGIADRFNLQPETILWGNYEVLQDDPHSLRPGQELNVLPVDGTYYIWHEGDGLEGVAQAFGVSAQDIIDFPGNGLSPSIDPRNPQIPSGTALIIPGGTREVVDWRTPRITRSNPAAARILGPGYCGSVYDGPVGSGLFNWPTVSQTISGYNFSSSLHPAVDFAGSEGNAVFASDAGVVVYAGWNNYGYGNVIVIDHGNGWQSLYAHLSTVDVTCGQGVYQGDVIGGVGSTGNSSGPHLHFELMHDEYGKVNPLDMLP
jgi:murein DD-endopeptidase MepM/ murein hydrolase activator NlpD